jgi:putative alpha-1,2-mannosidase
LKYTLGLGALVTFDKVTKEHPLVTRIGISFVSTSQACESAEKEVPTFDFDAVKESARQMWEETLGTIQVEGTSVDDMVLFYSSVSRYCSLYHHVCRQHVKMFHFAL